MKTNKIEWNGHKLHVKDKEKAEIIAYEKAFYFSDVHLNGKQIERRF